jgi:hypothetical protein
MSTYDIRPDGSRAGDDAVRPIFNEHVVLEKSSAGSPFGPRAARGPNGPEIGRFSRGTEASQWVLRRYLLTRAIGASIVRTVHWLGVSMLGLSVAIWFADVKWLAVLVCVAAFFVLAFRTLLSAIQRRLSGIDAMGPAALEVERLVGQTRKGVRAELRRVGLPSAPWGPALVGLRLLRGRRRADTLRRLTQFDLSQVVPASTLDELHLLLKL